MIFTLRTFGHLASVSCAWFDRYSDQYAILGIHQGNSMNDLRFMLRVLPASHPVRRQLERSAQPVTYRLPKTPTAHMKEVGARVLQGIAPDVAEQIYINTISVIPGANHQRHTVDVPHLMTLDMIKAATQTLPSRNRALACHVFNCMVKAKP